MSPKNTELFIIMHIFLYIYKQGFRSTVEDWPFLATIEQPRNACDDNRSVSCAMFLMSSAEDAVVCLVVKMT